MSVRMKVSAALVGAVLAGGGIATVATPAAADACPSGNLCAYLAPNFSGAPGQVAGDNTNLLQYNKFDNAESLWNAGHCNVRIFSGTGYSGSSYVLASNYTNPTLSGTVWYHNVAANDFCV